MVLIPLSLGRLWQHRWTTSWNKRKEMTKLFALKMDLSEWVVGKSVANVRIKGTSLVQWLRLCAPNAGGLDLIPHAATKDLA